MPNIWIVGFRIKEAVELREKIFELLLPIIKNPNDVVCTIFEADTLSGASKKAPYLVVRSTTDNLSVVSSILRQLKIDMEVEKPLLQFIPGDENVS